MGITILLTLEVKTSEPTSCDSVFMLLLSLSSPYDIHESNDAVVSFFSDLCKSFACVDFKITPIL